MWKYAASVKEIKNRVYLGGPGSGKSEIAMNTALSLADICPGKVHLFDLDQTSLFCGPEMPKSGWSAAEYVCIMKNRLQMNRCRRVV